jgi:hypothetical protein
MTSQIIEDHDVVWAESWGEYLLDIGQEALGIDRTIEDGAPVSGPRQVVPAHLAERFF